MEIFRTLHGSHLYGTAHSGSDIDIYVVTTEGGDKGFHKKVEDLDVSTRSLDVFLRQCNEGIPQALEALFSPLKTYSEYGEVYKPFLDGYRVPAGSQTIEVYRRTIKKFSFGDYKQRKHAVRLSLNLRELISKGSFEPLMYQDDLVYIQHLAEELEGDDLYTTIMTPWIA